MLGLADDHETRDNGRRAQLSRAAAAERK